jgi:ParB-like chromosome segregation protein Spo0J
MKTFLAKIEDIKTNPNNPRIIKDDKFRKLVASIKEFPKMLNIRPIVVNDSMIVLGGNMRLKACVEAGLKEVPVINASDLTDEEQRRFIIADNVGYGEWDWELLANEFDEEELMEWGLNVPVFGANDIEEADKNLNSQWFLNVEFESEEKCQQWYDKLIQEGLICKVVQ